MRDFTPSPTHPLTLSPLPPAPHSSPLIAAIDKTPANTDNSGMDIHLENLKFDANGLIPVIVQDAENGQVLMMAWMNRQALELTLQTQTVHTYSRSRGRIAKKGESSGHLQHVRQILTDCDRDVILVQATQDVAACHEGYRSCFFRQFQPATGNWEIIAEKVFDPKKVYTKK